MNAAQQHKASLEAQLSSVAGHAVEITIRGDKAFTFSFEAIDLEAAQRIVDYVSVAGSAKTEIETDDELQMTFVFADAN